MGLSSTARIIGLLFFPGCELLPGGGIGSDLDRGGGVIVGIAGTGGAASGTRVASVGPGGGIVMSSNEEMTIGRKSGTGPGRGGKPLAPMAGVLCGEMSESDGTEVERACIPNGLGDGSDEPSGTTLSGTGGDATGGLTVGTRVAECASGFSKISMENFIALANLLGPHGFLRYIIRPLRFRVGMS